MNPVETALEFKKHAASRHEKDMQVWQAWKADPTPQNTRAALQRFEPVYRQKQKLWKAPGVNPNTFKAELQKQTLKAFESYDPTVGAAVSTHVENNLRRAQRLNTQLQNVGYIPEEQASHIGRIQRATDELRDELGRDPNPQELVNLVNTDLPKRRRLTASKIQRIQQLQRKDVPASMFESDPNPVAAQREQEVMGLLRPALKPEEQTVFDHLYGQGGAQRMTSTTQLSKQLGLSPSKVSRLKSGIIKKYEQYK